MQWALAFLYANDEASKKENDPTHKSIKNGNRNKLTKEVKDLYNANWQDLTEKKIKAITKWKDVPCSWIRRKHITVTTESHLYRLSAIPVKIPKTLSTEIEQC